MYITKLNIKRCLKLSSGNYIHFLLYKFKGSNKYTKIINRYLYVDKHYCDLVGINIEVLNYKNVTL